jgi:manganese/zinc/iron transport system permease protein
MPNTSTEAVMSLIEQVIIRLLNLFLSYEQINTLFNDPRTVAVIVGGLIALSSAVLGSFLLLRGLALTTDAISHTVLLGIVVAFLVMVGLLGMEADLSSPLLIIGAAGAGVLTVLLTELIERSGLVKEDAALGLAFPFLFAIAILLIARFADNVHLDQDSVMVGEIGMASANANSYCFANCDPITITPDDPRAKITRECVNCLSEGISPRHPNAIFEAVCANCGTYTAGQIIAQASQGNPLVAPEDNPQLVFIPKSLGVMSILTLITLAFVGLVYKELKLATFDVGLAKAFGFRPALLHYLLMVLTSLVAVGAFDAVGSILVVAFFIIPPATAYLLTNRLWVMLALSPLIGVISVFTGYEFAKGNFLGLVDMSAVMRWLNSTFGMNLHTTWDSSISASIVLMMFFFLLMTWLFSPKFGVVALMIQRRNQQRQFAEQVVLGHIYHHQHTEAETTELCAATLHEHLKWSKRRMMWCIARLLALHYITLQAGQVALTERGEQRVRQFNRDVRGLSIGAS